MYPAPAAAPVSRHKLAQALAFANQPRSLSIWNFSALQWIIILLSTIAGYLCGIWIYTKCGRWVSRVLIGREAACDTLEVRKENSAGLRSMRSPCYRILERLARRSGRLPGITMLFMLCSIVWLWFRTIPPSSAFLEVFQVYQPVPVHGNNSSCNVEALLLEHVFGYSYGHPFVGYYEPPECEFDTVRINLTVTSRGRQFDRLAYMYLGDNEVFRTSTAEPTANGIIWTYIKDLSHYKALWRERQKVIFDLGNLVNDIYTGSFNVTVTAYFSHENNVKSSDIILPISAQNSAKNSSSVFNVPSQRAQVSHLFDARASRAVVSISACGQSTEEFWWSNVFSCDTETFGNIVGELYGYSPFREIQLYIDGILAGVVWPFPIIFTGGVAPGFWRPIVGIDAFDLREPEIDISPFLPLLTDYQYHSLEIKVVGLDLSGNGTAVLSDTVGSYWAVSGNIFLYLSDHDDDARSSVSRKPQVIAPAPTFAVSRELVKNQTGGNESLTYSVMAERTITVESAYFSWSQNLSFSNDGILNQQGLSQKTHQRTSGTASMRRLDGDGSNEVNFEYPISVNTTYGDIDSGLSIDASMLRGLEIDSTGMPGISTYTLTSGPLHLRTEQWGQASYRSSADNRNSTSFGDTSDIFESNAGGVVYRRSVRAVNGSIVADTDGL